MAYTCWPRCTVTPGAVRAVDAREPRSTPPARPAARSRGTKAGRPRRMTPVLLISAAEVKPLDLGGGQQRRPRALEPVPPQLEHVSPVRDGQGPGGVLLHHH